MSGLASVGKAKGGKAKRPPAWLEDARRMGDPIADVLFARLARRGKLGAVDDLIASVTSEQDPLPPNLPPVVRRFLMIEGLPSWTDRARVLRAQRFAERHSVAIACALFCASLPSAFTGAKGVSVLYVTRKLHDDVDRRVNETGRFVFDVLMPGGFESGRALRSTQKVRLLHAAVRYRVLAGRPAPIGTDVNIPINQEDLLGTLVCFSVVVLDALTKMGITFTADEGEDFMHLWRVVGAVLGIRESWLPKCVADARVLGEMIRARQAIPTQDGRELAAVLVDGIERHLPARGLGVVAPGLMRFFLGEQVAQTLGLPEGMRGADLAHLIPHASRFLGRIGKTALGTVLPKLGRSMLELVMEKKLGGAAPAFQAPLTAAGCPVLRREQP